MRFICQETKAWKALQVPGQRIVASGVFVDPLRSCYREALTRLGGEACSMRAAITVLVALRSRAEWEDVFGNDACVTLALDVDRASARWRAALPPRRMETVAQ